MKVLEFALTLTTATKILKIETQNLKTTRIVWNSASSRKKLEPFYKANVLSINATAYGELVIVIDR